MSTYSVDIYYMQHVSILKYTYSRIRSAACYRRPRLRLHNDTAKACSKRSAQNEPGARWSNGSRSVIRPLVALRHTNTNTNKTPSAVHTKRAINSKRHQGFMREFLDMAVRQFLGCKCQTLRDGRTKRRVFFGPSVLLLDGV